MESVPQKVVDAFDERLKKIEKEVEIKKLQAIEEVNQRENMRKQAAKKQEESVIEDINNLEW